MTDTYEKWGRSDLVAEIERLKAELAEAHRKIDAVGESRDRLRVDVAEADEETVKLREALRCISECENPLGDQAVAYSPEYRRVYRLGFKQAADVAKAALLEGK